ncbi:hypothetical protein BDF19DRAFT_453770 [Syncephalis fuscata]|nr:hypothetical protein BDF19DRAFT_453770 [Syncephalis fuscata]
MKLSIAVVCTVVVALIAATVIVDAKPALVRRAKDRKLYCILTDYALIACYLLCSSTNKYQ